MNALPRGDPPPSPAGRWIAGRQDRTDYWAFLPDPLPPDLVFDRELRRVVSDADRGLAELAVWTRQPPNPRLLMGPFVRREAVLSSRIEGTRTTVAGLYAYEAAQRDLPGFDPNVPEDDAREVWNYIRALEGGLDRLSTLPVSLRLIRELHAYLMEGVHGQDKSPGEFRRRQNYIAAPGAPIGAAH